MILILAGDIGGTNTRLRLEQRQDSGSWKLVRERSEQNQKIASLNSFIQEFLAGDSPHAVCLAIAGPVEHDPVSENDRVTLTNLHGWGELNTQTMRHELGLQKIRLINDFAAVGYGILDLKENDHQNSENLVDLQKNAVDPQAPIAVLGAGTGLGEAFLFWNKDRKYYEVSPTEGGHTDFAARTDIEIELLKYLRDRHGRVSVERVVSGSGIQAIYACLSGTNTVSELPSSEAIVTNAPENPLYQQTLEVFVSAYGAEAGNLALQSLPFGGLYVVGSIASDVLPQRQAMFMDNLLDKGRMKPLLEKIRVSLVRKEAEVGLTGAAYFARRLASNS